MKTKGCERLLEQFYPEWMKEVICCRTNEEEVEENITNKEW
jgi:hypothetical protein